MPTDLVADLRSALRAAADPSRAAGQQAYMKSAMPFLGVRAPEVRSLTRRRAQSEHRRAILGAAHRLWDGATYREERYAALALVGMPAVRADPAALPIIEHMVRSGRWWDYTDDLAHRIAEHLDARPEATSALLRGWSTDPDLWVRRLAVLGQLGRRERTDPDLLEAVITPNATDPEFFIRKAIGWALRDRARTDPRWVRDIATRLPLSPLSRREALKHLDAGSA